MSAPTPDAAALVRAAPLLFVLIWSTGWIVAKMITPYAEALTFLLWRFAAAGGVLLAVALIRGGWPRSRAIAGHALVSGVLLHAGYLGPTWWAIGQGVPAGVSSLMVALQPVLTVLLAPLLLDERIRPRQWAGVAAGLVGVGMVVWPKLAGVASAALVAAAVPLAVNAAGVVSVTAGTFYQKRFLQQGGDLFGLTLLQYAGAFLALLPAALLLEDLRVAWNLTTLGVLAWSVLGLSLGAILLYLLLIRRGAVSRAAALIYLVPVLSAAQAWALFGETLTPLQLVGMALTVLGVALSAAPSKGDAR